MLVIYRMTDIPSTNPSPIFQEDKFKLNQLCLRSFVAAFKEVKPKMYFILDHCDGRYVDMLERIVPFELDFEMTNMGINETMLKSYEIARESDDDIILFQECDHLWRNILGKQVQDAIKEFNLISFYDHPDFYTRYDIQRKETELKVFNNYHYRKSNRNVMSFGMTNKAFKDNYEILKRHGYLDGPVWGEMRENGYQLWTSIPGMSTHMVKDFLSPGIDWRTQYEL